MKYVIIEFTLVNQIQFVINAQRITVCPCPHLPGVVKSVLAHFTIIHVSEITCQTVYATIRRHVTHMTSNSSGLITYAISLIAVIVQSLSNQITSVLLRLKNASMFIQSVDKEFKCS